MTTTTLTLTDFLLARILSDEESVWDLAREDRPQWIARCDANRRIVYEVEGWMHGVCDDGWYTCAAATEEREGEECLDADRRGGACDCGRDFRAARILAILALPYADHPDYRDDWRA